MTRLHRTVYAAVATAISLGAVALISPQAHADSAKAVEAPYFEVDPFWPKPLPNKWILGNVIGVTSDERGHVWIVHRPTDSLFRGVTEIGLKSGVSECCTPAPPVLEFDPEGNLVKAWGGPGEGYTWPSSLHGIEVDAKGNLWLGGNGGAYATETREAQPFDSHILKFSRDGKFIAQFGEPGKGVDSHSMTSFSRVATIAIDNAANEAYLADGYGNKRVAVLDANTGKIKRYWGAYGNRPVDERQEYKPGGELPKQFRGPVHCARPTDDGLVYVCDRGADRVQVFKKDGTYVMEKVIAPKTLAQGSTWDIAFSTDKEQKYMYLVDGQNHKVYILDRKSMEVLTSFGDGGRQPGLFYAPHSINVDRQGNLYTTETYDGKRVQKFVYKGLKPVTKENQGAPWPKSEL